MERLTPEQTERYKANVALCEIDLAGQQKLLEAKVLVVGAGALASPALLYLAAAGIGTIGICDGDTVALSNLQRQIIHSTASIGEAKPVSAARRIAELNPDVHTMVFNEMLTRENIGRIFEGFDVILDCTDNYESRRLISDTAAECGKPLCIAAVSRFQGQVLTHVAGTATYSTLFPIPPTEESLKCNSCAETGVFNALTGICGSIQAAEAMKLITGTGEPLTDRLLLIDALTFEFSTIRL